MGEPAFLSTIPEVARNRFTFRNTFVVAVDEDEDDDGSSKGGEVCRSSSCPPSFARWSPLVDVPRHWYPGTCPFVWGQVGISNESEKGMEFVGKAGLATSKTKAVSCRSPPDADGSTAYTSSETEVSEGDAGSAGSAACAPSPLTAALKARVPPDSALTCVREAASRTSLSSNAPHFVPFTPAGTGLARSPDLGNRTPSEAPVPSPLPPATVGELRPDPLSMFRMQASYVANAAAIVLSRCTSCPPCTNVEVHEDPHGWTVQALLPGSSDQQQSRGHFIKRAKDAIMGEIGEASLVTPIGFCCEGGPFHMTPFGFSIHIGIMQDPKIACWEYFQHGRCCAEPGTCEKMHPAVSVGIVVQLRTHEVKALPTSSAVRT